MAIISKAHQTYAEDFIAHVRAMGGSINVTADFLESLLSTAQAEAREKTIKDCIEEIENVEIRTDEGGEYQSSDTELMRTEIMGAIEELSTPPTKDEFDDLKPFTHGEEGNGSTHYACAEIANSDGETRCCECTGHSCQMMIATEKKGKDEK